MALPLEAAVNEAHATHVRLFLSGESNWITPTSRCFALLGFVLSCVSVKGSAGPSALSNRSSPTSIVGWSCAWSRASKTPTITTWDKSTPALKALYNYVMDTKTHWENIYSTKAHSVSYHEVENIAGVRSQCHAYTELAGPSRHREGQQTKKTYSRQHERQSAEHAAKYGDEPILMQGLVNLLSKRLHMKD